jgi:hypothetical protein
MARLVRAIHDDLKQQRSEEMDHPDEPGDDEVKLTAAP